MKIISWNILHGGGTRLPAIIDAIEAEQADVVCLQEFRHGKSKEPLCLGLAKLGFNHCHTPVPNSNARNTLAVFSKHPISNNDLYIDKNQSVRCSSITVTPENAPTFNVIGVSFPHKKEQLPVFDVLLGLPDNALLNSTVIIGDFNCGIPFEDSETKTFYATHLFQRMLRKGWIDAWRSRHPKAREFTWFSTQKGNGFRYDHALCSPPINACVENIEYRHSVREASISDHSMLVVEFKL